MSAADEKRARVPLSRVWVALPLVITATLAVLFYWGLQNRDDALPSALLGRSVPEFSLPPVGGRGEGLSSDDLRGRSPS